MTRTDSATKIAAAAKIHPGTKKVVIRDRFGDVVSGQGPRYADVLALISRNDLTAGLDSRTYTVAYALRKCMISGRMEAVSELRIAQYTPHQICKLVARISRECPETTLGGICDDWIPQNHRSL